MFCDIFIHVDMQNEYWNTKVDFDHKLDICILVPCHEQNDAVDSNAWTPQGIFNERCGGAGRYFTRSSSAEQNQILLNIPKQQVFLYHF